MVAMKNKYLVNRYILQPLSESQAQQLKDTFGDVARVIYVDGNAFADLTDEEKATALAMFPGLELEESNDVIYADGTEPPPYIRDLNL